MKGHSKSNPTPPPPAVTNCALNLTIANSESRAEVILSTDMYGKYPFSQVGQSNRWYINLFVGGGTGATIIINKDGCVPISHRLMDSYGRTIPIPMSGAWELEAEELKSILPPDYSRDKALSVNTSFMGGLIIPSNEFGLMPWWDSALSWCNKETRNMVYAAKKANNETHCIIGLPDGKPLYDEDGQFYSPANFGAIDWRGSMDNFSNLIKEVLEQGFAFQIMLDEIEQQSFDEIRVVAPILKDIGVSKDGYVTPGYDGVFYGWSPEDIMNWGSLARSINPDILLGLEFTHLPLGEGAPIPDYGKGGRMRDFDIILSESNSFGPTVGPCDDTTWQIIGRCIHPYIRPADQPSGDDPNPPFVLLDCERGPRYYCYFETADPYHWVRINPNDSGAVKAAQDRIKYMRQYARNLGCSFTG